MLKEDTDNKKYNRFNSDNKTWMIFYSLIFLTFLLVNIFPKATVIKEAKEKDCISKIYEELGYPCLPFNYEENPIYTVEIKPEETIPFSVLAARPRRRMSMAASSVTLKGEISLYIIDDDEEIIDRIYIKKSVSHSLNCNDVTVHCDSMELGSAQNLKDARYIFVINFFNIDRVRAAHISEVDLFFINSNRSYTEKLVFLHQVLFFISFFIVLRLTNLKTSERNLIDDLNDLISLGYSLVALNNPFSYFIFVKGSIISTAIGNIGVALGSTFLLNYFDSLANKLERVARGKGFKPLCVFFFIFVLNSTRSPFDHQIEAQSLLNDKWLNKFINFADVIGTLVKLTAFIFVLRKYIKIIKEQNILPKERTVLVISSFFLIIFMILSFTDCLMIDFFSTAKNIYLICFINFYFLIMARIKFQENERNQIISFKKVDINVEDAKNL